MKMKFTTEKWKEAYKRIKNNGYRYAIEYKINDKIHITYTRNKTDINNIRDNDNITNILTIGKYCMIKDVEEFNKLNKI